MANEASWDPWRTAKSWTLADAAYLCRGKRPVRDDEHRRAGTTHGADVRAMAERLRAEVPNEKVRTRYWRRYDWIFQRTAVEAWAKLNGFRLPWEASAESPPSPATRIETLRRLVGALAHILAARSDRYRHIGGEPNVSAIADAVLDILAELPDAETRGLGTTNIRDNIAAGLRLLATDDKTGKSLRPFLSD